MRITGGEFKGRLLKVPKIANIRPSTEKIREAIFSSLGDSITDSTVADFFCGSGALGIEALSRGARHATFIDTHPRATAIVRENIAALGLENRSRIFTMNLFHLRPAKYVEFGIIFADPPYKNRYADKLLLSLQKSAWNGILVLEHEAEWSLRSDSIVILRRLDFGDSSVSILLRENDVAESVGEK